jgi:hypothetical protein
MVTGSDLAFNRAFRIRAASLFRMLVNRRQKMKSMLRSLLLISVLISCLAFRPGLADSTAVDDPPPPSQPSIQTTQAAANNFQVFLPLLLRSAQTYTVSGQVVDEMANPVAGALITGGNGQSAFSTNDGAYHLQLPEGETALSPSKNGYVFSPAMVDVEVSGNLSGQNFTALTACANVVSNTGFENDAWWGFPASDWPASYSISLAHSGARSARTGIQNPADNRYSYSSVRSPLISIPSSSSSATLRLWVFPLSGEPSSAPLPEQPQGSDLAKSPSAYDAQYVMVLDSTNQILEILLWNRSNSQLWTFLEFNLTKWAGQNIKIQVGVYNDGTDGATAMFVDDVSVEICPGAPPPPPGSCINQIANSGFESYSAWDIPYTNYPAAYSSDYAYSGARSMRTGIPLWSASNVYSYSDAWQTVYIPANATSVWLSLRLFPRSEEAPPLAPEAAPAVGTTWGESPLANDAQYLLILDPWSGSILETLIWWQPKNATNWVYREFDMLKYKGQSIRIQFGTYNNGYSGRSVMYVDELVLQTCVSVTPPPPPPPVCSERIANGGFESNSAWTIPLTEFSAGYSTWLAHGGARSMRSGIVYQAHNRYSYSDFRQTISIPSGVSSAVLGFWAYPISGEAYNLPLPERPTSLEFGQSAMSGDVQYLLVLDYYGNWIDTLLWQRSNEQYWHFMQFNLKPYAGRTIQLQWGSYNNGWDGVTAMYVDDVSLVACP